MRVKVTYRVVKSGRVYLAGASFTLASRYAGEIGGRVETELEAV